MNISRKGAALGAILFGVLAAAIPVFVRGAGQGQYDPRLLSWCDYLALPGDYLAKFLLLGSLDAFFALTVVLNFLFYALVAYLVLLTLAVNAEPPETFGSSAQGVPANVIAA